MIVIGSVFERGLKSMATGGSISNGEAKMFPLDPNASAEGAGKWAEPHLAHTRVSSSHKAELQRKDDFLSMASHELKTPITTLKAFLQMVGSGEGPEVLVSKVHLRKMVDQVDRLTRLVSDLLEVSKIQKGDIEFSRDPMEVDPLVMEVVADARMRHQTHRFTLTGASGCRVVGDRARVMQALTELLNNAVKFSPAADLIEVHIGCSGPFVEITVSDHGVGMPNAAQEHIFERYYRVLTDPEKPFPGLGVGLFIVSEIVRHHGGTVSVSSVAGEGSSFTVAFPAAMKIDQDGNSDT